MNSLSLLLPKHQHSVWIDDLENIESEAVALISIPLLGKITAGNPLNGLKK